MHASAVISPAGFALRHHLRRAMALRGNAALWVGSSAWHVQIEADSSPVVLKAWVRKGMFCRAHRYDGPSKQQHLLP